MATITNIVNRIYRLTRTNSTSYPAADMLEDINFAYNRVASLIMGTDNRWQWDDTNQTDLPIATTNLVSGQQDYSITNVHLKITRVEISTTATGTPFQVLQYYDQTDESGSLTYNATLTGVPYRYDIIGSSLFLDPKPNYSCTAGLKIYYQRGPAEFTSAEVSTGTKQPGFSSLYHDLIPLWVAFDWWLINDVSQTAKIKAQIDMKEAELKKDYALRNLTDHQNITTSPISYK